jgi:hypothetical protein
MVVFDGMNEVHEQYSIMTVVPVLKPCRKYCF